MMALMESKGIRFNMYYSSERACFYFILSLNSILSSSFSLSSHFDLGLVNVHRVGIPCYHFMERNLGFRQSLHLFQHSSPPVHTATLLL